MFQRIALSRPCDPQRAAGRCLLAEPPEPRVPERRGQLDGCLRRWLDPEGHRTGAGIAGQRRHASKATGRRSSSATRPPSSHRRWRRMYRSNCSTVAATSSVTGSRSRARARRPTPATSTWPTTPTYQWRVRAEFEGQPGPWSAVAAFKTPPAPVAGGAFTGGVGAQRSIGVQEAVGILIRVHDDLRYDLGRNSTRELAQRLALGRGGRGPLRTPALQRRRSRPELVHQERRRRPAAVRRRAGAVPDAAMPGIWSAAPAPTATSSTSTTSGGCRASRTSMPRRSAR